MPLSYDHVSTFTGGMVSLACNMSADGMWTYDAGDGRVDYIYWNRMVSEGRFTVNTSADGVRSLMISPAEFADTGLYDCYDGGGRRTVGYQLVVNTIR